MPTPSRPWMPCLIVHHKKNARQGHGGPSTALAALFAKCRAGNVLNGRRGLDTESVAYSMEQNVPQG